MKAFALLTSLASLAACFAVLLPNAFAEPSPQKPLRLAVEGRTDYAIVLPEKAGAVEQRAATELQNHLNQITGAEFAVLEHGAAADRALRIEIASDAKLPYDAISLGIDGMTLKLGGHPQRGPLYAVYTFLEDVGGVRWWTPTETDVPKRPTFEVSAADLQKIPGLKDGVYAPKLIYRETYYNAPMHDGVFSARMKCNGAMNPVSEEYGDHHRFMYFVHSFFPLLPPEKYFAEHPEWYSEIDGKRKHEHAQLCLTNTEMRAELIKNVLAALRRDPKAKFISISQNDWYGYCTCAECNKVVEEEGGAQSGLLVRFVNAVAEEIEKEFPEVFVETLAYQYTRKPPKSVKPRDNVVIRLCTIECSFVEPLETAERNRSLREDMEGWSAIAKNLFVWDYVTNFTNYLIPHPNRRVLAPNIRFFVKNNTIGLFEQGDVHCKAGDFVPLRNWIISKLMWNPELDQAALETEFLNGYYGPEIAPLLRRVLDVVSDAGEKADRHIGCFDRATSAWLTADDIDKATLAFDEALLTARKLEYAQPEKHAGLSAKIRRERLSLDHVWLLQYKSLQRQAKVSGRAFLGPVDPAAACMEFWTLCDANGVTSICEWQKPEELRQYREQMFTRFGPLAGPPEECAGLPENSWLDYQEFDFNLHKLGEWTMAVDDPAASNKRAAKMPGDHFEWATGFPIPVEVLQLKSKSDDPGDAKFHFYVWVRCDAEAADGPAMTMGVYDSETKKSVAHRSLGVADIKGAEYKMIDLGVMPLSTTMYFWAAPPKRPGEVQAVYVDRLVIVRE